MVKIGAPTVKRQKQRVEHVHREGEARKADEVRNCLSCKLYTVCMDDKRHRTYRCSKWQEMPSLGILFENDGHPMTRKGMATEEIIKNIKSRTGDDLDLEQMVAEALDSKFGMSSANLTFDDRDIPTPANFLEWITDDDYAGSPDWKPFSMQAKIATEFMAEYCPRCSDLKYLNKPKVSHTLDQFFERVQILEHGICPSCGVSKSKLVKNGEINDYYELAAVLGQRSGKCVEASTLITTPDGMLTIGEMFYYAGVQGYGATPKETLVTNERESVKTTHFYKSPPENLYEVTTRSGMRVAGTACHPLLTGWRGTVFADASQYEYTVLSEITKGAVIPRYIGQNVWGKNESLVSKELSVKDIYEANTYGIPTGLSLAVRTSCRDGIVRAVRAIYESSRLIRHGIQITGTDTAIPVSRLKVETVSFNLANQLSSILLNLGIQCYLVHNKEDEADETNVVIDSEYGLEKFLNTVCLPDTELYRLTSQVLKEVRSGKYGAGRCDLYPFDIKISVLNVLKILVEKSQDPVCAQRLSKLQTKISTQRHEALTRKDIISLLQDLPKQAVQALDRKTKSRLDALLKLALNQNIFFDMVESVKQRPYEEDSYDFTVPKGHRFIGNGLVNHNTFMATMLDSYSIAKWLKLPSPQAVFGIPRQQILTGTFVSLTFGQARENYWEPLNNFFTMSSWYQKYHEVLKYYGELNGEELYTHKDIFMRYRHRGLFFHPSGPNKRTLRGKCLVGSTIVNTSLGFASLEELVKENGQHPVEGLFIDSHKGIKRVSHTYKDFDKTIKVTTKNGFTLEGTAEHPVLVLDRDLKYKWRRIDSLSLGDHIVSTTVNNNPQYGTLDIPKAYATILGYLTANGHNTSFSSDNEEVIRRFRKAAKSTGVLKLSQWNTEEGRVNTYNLIKGKKAKFGSVWSDFLKPLGYTSQVASSKEIPISIRMSPKNILHEYLESYFECDSGVNGFWHGSQGPSTIELSTASAKLAEQLHVILSQAYGIVGRRRSFSSCALNSATPVNRVYHTVSLVGYDANLFLNTFKRAKVSKYKERFWDVPKGLGSDRRSVPWIREYLWDLYETARLRDGTGKRLRRLTLEDGTVILNTVNPKMFERMSSTGNNEIGHYPQGLTYDNENWEVLLPRIRQISKKAAKRVEKVIERNAHYEEVVSIEQVNAVKAVYDFTVPDGRCFTANSLASHNTRLLSSIDEGGWFPVGDDQDQKERMSGFEVFKALQNSMVTLKSAHRRLIKKKDMSHIPKPTVTLISSPSEVNDLIMTKYRAAIGSKNVYGIKKATWEINPGITKDDLQSEFHEDAVKAMRDFGAEPPLSSNAWIGDISNAVSAFKGRRSNVSVIQKRFTNPNSGVRQTTATVSSKSIHNGMRIMALDAGYVNNSFAFAVGTLVDGIPVIEAIGEIIPSKKAPISFTRVHRDALIPIIKDNGVQVVVTDRWQNIKMLQDLEDEAGIYPHEYRMRYSDFDSLREAIYDDEVVFPKLEDKQETIFEVADNYPDNFMNKPAMHLLYQILTVRDFPGSSVEKGSKATDDIFRAVALCYAMLKTPEIAAMLHDRVGRRKKSLGAVSSGGGSGGGSSRVGALSSGSSGGGGSTSSSIGYKASTSG